MGGEGGENTFFSSSSFAGLVRRFPNIPEHFLRFPKIFKNCRKIALRTFRFFPKTSADFQNFQKLVGILVFTLFGIFPEFSKEFPKIQQRRHELLLPVTDRPVFFFHVCYEYVIIRLFSFKMKFIHTSEFLKKYQNLTSLHRSRMTTSTKHSSFVLRCGLVPRQHGQR